MAVMPSSPSLTPMQHRIPRAHPALERILTTAFVIRVNAPFTQIAPIEAAPRIELGRHVLGALTPIARHRGEEPAFAKAPGRFDVVLIGHAACSFG
jgi:hypothetical protein